MITYNLTSAISIFFTEPVLPERIPQEPETPALPQRIPQEPETLVLPERTPQEPETLALPERTPQARPIQAPYHL